LNKLDKKKSSKNVAYSKSGNDSEFTDKSDKNSEEDKMIII